MSSSARVGLLVDGVVCMESADPAFVDAAARAFAGLVLQNDYPGKLSPEKVEAVIAKAIHDMDALAPESDPASPSVGHLRVSFGPITATASVSGRLPEKGISL